ncbi:hypothetical protein [Kineococcus sp. SYSU DK005]|uniref:hypothetical protein n=1 Tax=Kineococcus sp. SYSU DK005 TaxID=3383126 RepID=UPI003D7CFD2E
MSGPPYRDYPPEDERALPPQTVQRLRRGQQQEQEKEEVPRHGCGVLRIRRGEPGQWHAWWQDEDRDAFAEGEEDLVRAWVSSCSAPVRLIYLRSRDEHVALSEQAWAQARGEQDDPLRRSTSCISGEEPRAGHGALRVQVAEEGRWIGIWQDEHRRASFEAAPALVSRWALQQPAAVKTSCP